tara:strand:+ start:363 stop:956 length:594 start_codon:yes stop_codon:yes gene_type:complete
MTGSKKKKTMDDVSDDDEDWYDTQADIDREANDDEDDASKLPNFESYDEFWAFTQEKNAQAVRDAGGDPAKTPGADNLPKGRHGEVLKKGVPLSGKVRCWACDAVTTTQLECALCLEIMKERAVKAAYDNWERAFFCSHLCYREHYPNHKARHGPSKSVPTKTDGTIHRFPCAEGCGALWDAKTLKRYNFEECEPYD